MEDIHDQIIINGIVSATHKNKNGDLEIFLNTKSWSGLPKLSYLEQTRFVNAINDINFLIYPVPEEEEAPKIKNTTEIEAGIPYSMSVLRDSFFRLNGSLINYLSVKKEDGAERYFPLEI